MTTGRIAVTGVGITSALGQSADVTFRRLLRGERGFSEVSLFDTAGQRTRVAAEVVGFDARHWEEREGLGPLSHSDALALAAARDAISVSGLPPGRLGVVVGATTGGMLEAEPVLADGAARPTAESARRLISYPMSNTAERLARAFGAEGRVATVSSACSSGAGALIQGALWLQGGEVDVVLAGGTDALCRLTVTGFNALGATDIVACRPFDRERGGLTLGEGAAFLVLEPEASAARRGARVLAWLSGWAEGAEAHHITQPEPTSRMPARLLSEAIARAGLTPADIDYLNAHGTGTSNDAVESAGIRAAFGAQTERLLVSSSKGQLGHTLGAAGAIEAAITVLALDRQWVPPTGGLVEPDVACALNHVMSVGRAARLRAAASSAFGFGGAGAVLVFEEASATRRGPSRREPEVSTSVAITGVATLSGAPDLIGALEPSRSRRFDVQTALVTLAAERALKEAALSPAGVGLVAGAAFGAVERTASFLRIIAEKGIRRAPPAEFPHLLPSSPPGNASIYLGLTGPVLTTSGLDASAELSVLVACDLLSGSIAPAVIAGGVVVDDAFSRDVLGPACAAVAQGRTDAARFFVLEREADARKRRCAILGLVVERTEWPAGAEASRAFAPPRSGERALIVGATPETAAFATRSGWSGARTHSDGSAPSDGLGTGFAVALAALHAGEVDDALVFGRTAARVYAFHLTGAS
ncbi:MAG TPA: beta-ketoacyl-[acyl-carrier-protein] synthase family protein [Polyangiaceae bacterium]|jgi:3-oxoacyl-[acyl-carrier-protein] synthase II|nr:beta-ketoacyl-[acyl-carrier-protein] synthase family protein [Polyangiaceae bacterium]